MPTTKNPRLRFLRVSLLLATLAIPILVALPCSALDPQPPHPGFRTREVRVGLYENEPKIFTSSTGHPAGIFVGILAEIARRENWQLTYVPCEWSEGLAALEEGRIDLMPDVAFSPERARTLDFHEEEVVSSWSELYVRKNTPFRSLSDLNGRRLALLKGSIQQPYVLQMITGFGYTVSIVETHSYEEAFTLVSNGAVDAAVANHFYGDYYYQHYGLAQTAILFNPVSLYFATAHGANHDLLEAIDRDLRLMKSEPGSVYYKELASWMERPPQVMVPRYLFWIIGGIAGSLALAFVVILLLRTQVRIRTRHLVLANETLRESEEKFRRLFQNHLAVKLIIDPADGTIVEANAAATRFYGWPEEQLRRMRMQDIDAVSPEQGQAEMERIRATQGVRFEGRHRLADGSIRDVEVFSSTIEMQGRTFLHSIVHDITEHRKLEEQYRQAQKMEYVGRLAGGVAHDFNNILSVILGYTELALAKVDASEPLYADLREILNAARRSSDITRQLLAFARKQTISPRVLDVNEAVEGMRKMLQRLIGEDIHLGWLPEPGLWPVKLDPSQIEQIVVNLCVNARDAIAGVGRVTIETHMVTCDEAQCADGAATVPGEFVLLTVNDDGCGMDKETVDHIFEPFFTTKDVNRGTGLGLATVYGIVKQNNGFIKVYSEPGKGTTFEIYLPRHEGEVETTTAGVPAEIPTSKGEVVLLVDDDSAVMRLSRRVLERLGYQVLTAATPAEALHLARDERAGDVHLLITDVVMPGMSGRALADQLLTLYPDIRVLFMSGYTPDVIARRGVLNEGVHFVQKPCSMMELGAKVREILDGK